MALVLHGIFTVTIPYLLLEASRPHPFLWFDIGPLEPGGLVLLLGGIALYVWPLARLLRRRTSALPGQTPTTLDTGGPYRFVRHPLLLGVILIMFGEAMYFESTSLIVYAASYWSWLNYFVWSREEPELHRFFGGSYANYCRKTPRWLPRFPPS